MLLEYLTEFRALLRGPIRQALLHWLEEAADETSTDAQLKANLPTMVLLHR